MVPGLCITMGMLGLDINLLTGVRRWRLNLLRKLWRLGLDFSCGAGAEERDGDGDEALDYDFC